MSLILIILQIISAIPTIIKVIKEIIDIIHGLKGAEKKAAETQFKGLLLQHLRARDPDLAHIDLAQFRDDLKGKYGV